MTGAGVLVLIALAATAGALVWRTGRAARMRRPHGARPAEPRPAAAVAERRARELLRSVVNPEEWAMFAELGFICVRGHSPARGTPGRFRYLVYPHLPVVALLPGSWAPVREYCLQFPDRGRGRAERLPEGDDVLAKWMTLRGDEDRMLAFANVTGAGCQVPIDRVERDIARLRRWQAVRRAPGTAAVR